MATKAQTKYDGELEVLAKKAQNLELRMGLLRELQKLELEEAGVVQTPTVREVPGNEGTAPQGDATVKRGRPKAAAKPKTGQKAGVPAGDGKTIDLPTLLETIGQNLNKPLALADFVTLVRESGYTTKAKDFSNMVYQALLKLVKRGKFKKNDETRCYEYVAAKAA